jgi:hypothetical protein
MHVAVESAIKVTLTLDHAPKQHRATLWNSNEPAANDGQPTLSIQLCLMITMNT